MYGVGLSLMLIGLLILILSSKLFKRPLLSFLPDIVYGMIDTGTLVIFAYVGLTLAGLLGAAVSIVVSDAITDSFGGAIEGKVDEILRKRGIDTSRTLKTTSVGKFAGCLIGGSVVLVIAGY